MKDYNEGLTDGMKLFQQELLKQFDAEDRLEIAFELLELQSELLIKHLKFKKDDK